MRLPDKIQLGGRVTYLVCTRFKARSEVLSTANKHAHKQHILCILMVDFRITIEKNVFQHTIFWDILMLKIHLFEIHI